MNWSGDKSITLSQVCTAAFAVLLAALDIANYWLVGLFIRLREMNWQQGAAMMAVIYLCSVFGWIFLFKLWRLLKNIKRGAVFCAENVSLLRAVSWCCAGVALVCLLGALCYLPFIIAALAAAFMALIVRIVKNAFNQAVEMKDELDFTV